MTFHQQIQRHSFSLLKIMADEKFNATAVSDHMIDMFLKTDVEY